MNQLPLGRTAVAAAPIAAVILGGLVSGALWSAPAQAASSTDSAAEPWSLESDCAACHISQAQSAEEDGAPYAMHALLGLEECSDCHDDADGKLTKAHAKYLTSTKVPTRLSKSTVSVETCTASGCHAIDELIEETEDSAVLEDEKGTQVNAHAMLLSETHETAKITCASCHVMHSAPSTDEDDGEADPDDSATGSADSTSDAGNPAGANAEASTSHDATVERSLQTCETCHHEGVFECYTCHS